MQCLREGRRFTCEDHNRVVTRSKNGAEGGDADDAQRGVASGVSDAPVCIGMRPPGFDIFDVSKLLHVF